MSEETDLLVASRQALEALLLWEELHPRTNAHGPRNRAIEALMAALAPYNMITALELNKPTKETP